MKLLNPDRVQHTAENISVSSTSLCSLLTHDSLNIVPHLLSDYRSDQPENLKAPDPKKLCEVTASDVCPRCLADRRAAELPVDSLGPTLMCA